LLHVDTAIYIAVAVIVVVVFLSFVTVVGVVVAAVAVGVVDVMGRCSSRSHGCMAVDVGVVVAVAVVASLQL